MHFPLNKQRGHQQHKLSSRSARLEHCTAGCGHRHPTDESRQITMRTT